MFFSVVFTCGKYCYDDRNYISFAKYIPQNSTKKGFCDNCFSCGSGCFNPIYMQRSGKQNGLSLFKIRKENPA